MRSALSLGACLAVHLLVHAAGLRAASAAPAAPTVSAADAATARTLFNEGRKLMKAGKFDEACPKLEEGVRLNPGIGMRFNLAECWEHLGRTASAWSLYLDVAAAAKEAKQTKRAKIAQAAADKLEKKLARLEITSEGDTPGLEITRNGTAVGAGQLGIAVAVDPGPYVIEATAPGRIAWSTKVDVEGEGAHVVVRVPRLREKPKPAPEPTTLARPEERSGLGATRTAALVIGGVGLVATGVGAWFGVRAMGLNDDSAPHCEGNVCDAEGFALRNDARSAGNTATISIGLGLVAIGTAAALFAFAPSTTRDRPAVTAIAPFVAPASAGLALGGTFE